ncbi:unnamed protein product [Fraxinus pennsylvanica]|uniref:Uncharacterized protein n=1 Tax=Fraxinus pennsylvanica TaxID=56036 RepID=A0AAD2E343_9LAMI|nr:unnamed protein product [Fraxinus pennsylvanica]
MSSQRNMDSSCGRFISSQPQGYTDPTSLPNGQNIFQQENQMQSGLDSNCADFGFSWVPPIRGSNQQIPAGSSQLQNPVPADNFLYQSVAKEDDAQFQSVPAEDNSYVHVPEDSFSLVDDINSRFPGITDPDSLDFQFDTWMFENQSVPGALEVSVPPGLNAYSPEPGTIDAGTLFEF